MSPHSTAKALAGKKVTQLICEELTLLWLLSLAGYLHVVNGVVHLTKP